MTTFHGPELGRPIDILPMNEIAAADLSRQTVVLLGSFGMPPGLELVPIAENGPGPKLPLTAPGGSTYTPEFHAVEVEPGVYGVHTVFPMMPERGRYAEVTADYKVRRPAPGFTGWAIRVETLKNSDTGEGRSLGVTLGGLARAISLYNDNALVLPGYTWHKMNRLGERIA